MEFFRTEPLVIFLSIEVIIISLGPARVEKDEAVLGADGHIHRVLNLAAGEQQLGVIIAANRAGNLFVCLLDHWHGGGR